MELKIAKDRHSFKKKGLGFNMDPGVGLWESLQEPEINLGVKTKVSPRISLYTNPLIGEFFGPLVLFYITLIMFIWIPERIHSTIN